MRNEWTKITDGLPPIGVPLIVTVKDNLQGKEHTQIPRLLRKSERWMGVSLELEIRRQ